MAEDFLTDVEISKVYEGKSGEGEFGKWTAYNFYIEGDERKFSWFKSDSKPTMPVQGMRIKLMEYAVKQSGEYTNYNVSRIVLQEKQPETIEPSGLKKHTPQKSGRDSSLTMYISYAKDLVCKMMELNPSAFDSLTVNQIADMTTETGMKMYDRAKEEPVVETDKATKDIESKFLDDGPPEDMFPPPHGE